MEVMYDGLEVSQTNDDVSSAHFLDLRLLVNDGRFELSTYDKRDDFPFDVRGYPNLSGNLHIRRAHGVVSGALRRFAAACDRWPDYKTRLQPLTTQLLEQHFNRELLEEKIGKYYDKNVFVRTKYNVTRRKYIDGCFEQSIESGTVVETREKDLTDTTGTTVKRRKTPNARQRKMRKMTQTQGSNSSSSTNNSSSSNNKSSSSNRNSSSSNSSSSSSSGSSSSSSK